jgi:Thymidylate kinase
MSGHAMSLPVMAPDQGRLVVIDAIDGAGKDTVAERLRTYVRKTGRNLVDLDEVARGANAFYFERGDDPRLDGVDAIYVSQPTYVGIGRVIRGEIMKHNAYDVRATAQAYALDRQVLYERTILPFLRARPGRIVLQGRGLMSTLAYQTVQGLTIPELLELPGNRLELSRRPDCAIILEVSTETAVKRLAGRTNKIDDDKFAEEAFQKRVSRRYRDEDLKKVFTKLGTRIEFVDAEDSPDEVAAKCVAYLESVIAT